MNQFSYTTFQIDQTNALTQPMFFGKPVNVSRFDEQKHSIFERLIEKQLSFFWRPEEVDLSKDRVDFQHFSDVEKHIFLSNLKYQTLLDSIQGRSPNIAFLPLVSLPELETWIETWSFSETIHSRSYTHMVRSMLDDPSIVFNDIVGNENIKARAQDITRYYDDLILKTQLLQSVGEGDFVISGESFRVNRYEVKKALYFALHAVNALEAIRFYVSFACTFAFSEQKKLEGSGKIMKLIARDESLHLASTQHMINIIQSGSDGDSELTEIAHRYQNQAKAIFLEAIDQEKKWAKYLFEKGSILGLNEAILCQYVDYIAKERMAAISLEYDNKDTPKSNPIPWINSYLNSDNVQVAPQETEISSYLVGQVESSLGDNAFKGFEL
ncbi:class Ia ribonucleoside-diphosphate reductase subunit beta [Fangia hongkongensis]|uniref:class Ia ribonucleoside-diphosphate reductase subunit beta n=1 Tax=Fangia hongkongensis TaxID=270495 RepID=UPI00036D56E0|nr:class Ia ribonucleoside-diphosphate reductase subunit beta [Fangia hongkongensis]MBK2124772.1 ribonucleotide-diphosphate reductase subunit beta [Fangia hongkongensis]